MQQTVFTDDGAKPDISDDACKQLWCAVLEQAVSDAKRPRPVFVEQDWEALAEKRREKGKNGTAKSLREGALVRHSRELSQWRIDRDYIGSRSFVMVCNLCGLDPDAAAWRVRQQMPADDEPKRMSVAVASGSGAAIVLTAPRSGKPRT